MSKVWVFFIDKLLYILFGQCRQRLFLPINGAFCDWGFCPSEWKLFTQPTEFIMQLFLFVNQKCQRDQSDFLIYCFCLKKSSACFKPWNGFILNYFHAELIVLNIVLEYILSLWLGNHECHIMKSDFELPIWL